jgi:hypothetical protein
MATAMRTTETAEPALTGQAETGLRHIGEILCDVLAEHRLHEPNPLRMGAADTADRRRKSVWPLARSA